MDPSTAAAPPLTRSRAPDGLSDGIFTSGPIAATSMDPPVGLYRTTGALSRPSQSMRNASSIRAGPTTRSRKRRANETGTVVQTSRPAKRTRARTKAGLKKAPPAAGTGDGDKKPAPSESCCICMCVVEPDDLAGINGCEHRFCFGCIEKWAERENTCPLCKNRFIKIDRVNKKRKKGHKNTKKVKQRDQRSDLVPGAALEGLLGRLIEESRNRIPGRANDLTELLSPANFASRHPNPPSIARLIFSGVGGFSFGVESGAAHRLSRAPGSAVINEEFHLSSDEEDSPLSTFIRAFQGHSSVIRPITMPQMASMSYARNIGDRTAGNRAENPLEIDDDSDDDIEVLEVRRPA